MLHETKSGIYLDSEQDIKNDIRFIIQNLTLEEVETCKNDYREFGAGRYILDYDFLREPLDNSNVYYGVTTTIWNNNVPYDGNEEVEAESLLEYIEKHDDMFDFLQDCLKDRFWEVA